MTILALLLPLVVLLSSSSSPSLLLFALADIPFVQQTNAAPWYSVAHNGLLMRVPFDITYRSATTSSSSPTEVVAPANSFVLLPAYPDNSVWITTDQGVSWGKMMASEPARPNDAKCVASRATGTMFNIGADRGKASSIWRSTNGGVTWSDVASADPTKRLVPAYAPALAVSRDGGVLVVAGGFSVNGTWQYLSQVSFDGGVTMSTNGNKFTYGVTYLDFVASRASDTPDQVLMRVDTWAQYVGVSTDLGATWSSAPTNGNWSHRSSTALALTQDDVYVMFGGWAGSPKSFVTNDVWISLDAGVNWISCGTAVGVSPREEMRMDFDAEGHLVIAGGIYVVGITGVPYNDVWRSAISFRNMTALSQACEPFEVPVNGIGYQGEIGKQGRIAKLDAIVIPVLVVLLVLVLALMVRMDDVRWMMRKQRNLSHPSMWFQWAQQHDAAAGDQRGYRMVNGQQHVELISVR